MSSDRREREKKTNREAILRAANVVFAEKGFDGAILDEIAELAEFSKGAIYGYFKNKEDLFISLIDEELNKVFKITKNVVESPLTPIEKIKELVQKTLAFFEANREFFCIFMPERGGFTKKQHPKIMKKV
ncbi:MAG: TetR/AcrR family transcriptional regulator, partial [Candidatus Stahlbacteria bacterium]|nr:TetR/AcrR family transcriptional regulator [Candidatus Stahlbacteria bacterium]